MSDVLFYGASRTIRYVQLDERAKVPSLGTDGSAGADLRALLDGPIIIQPGETVLIHTGIALEIPMGIAGLVFARSGLASKRGLAPANKVGVIDSDYRGEIMIPLHNHSSAPTSVEPDERVAQIAFVPVVRPVFEQTDSLDGTGRGDKGFGSTGSK